MLARSVVPRLLTVALLFLPGVTGAAPPAGARVELIAVGEKGNTLEFQQWMQALGKVGAARVQVRSRLPTDKVGIEYAGTPDRPVYIITASVDGQQLVGPGFRFGRGEMPALAQWIAELAQKGPPSSREPVVGLGLTAKQLDDARGELSKSVGFSTAGKDRAEVVQQIAARLGGRLQIGGEALQALRGDTVAEELATLACGTALACVVRPAGLALTPVVAGGQVRYAIGAAKPGQDVWPVGWKPDKLPKDTLPVLVEFLNVNIQGVSAAKAIDALGKRIQAPLLFDHNALARHGVDLEKVTVTLPPGKSTYSLILNKVLFQARLKFEVRVDEAQTPLIWITTVKPL